MAGMVASLAAVVTGHGRGGRTSKRNHQRGEKAKPAGKPF